MFGDFSTPRIRVRATAVVTPVETLTYFSLLPYPHRRSPILQTTAVPNNSEGSLDKQSYAQ